MSDMAGVAANRDGVESGEDGAQTESGSGIGNAIWSKMKGFVPDLSKLYLQPLDASSDMSFSDRIRLIFRSARPIGDFLDLSNMNLPPLAQVTTRLSHNIETYLYNYFLVGCLHLGLFSLVHFESVFVVTCWCGLVWFLYVVNKDTIDVGGKFEIGKIGKGMIAGTAALLGIWFGNVSTLVMSVIVFGVIVVGIHGVLRDDTPGVDMTMSDITSVA